MRIALAQINPVVGDLSGNGVQLLEACRSAAANGAELVVASELALWGYPARDLLLRPSLRERQQQVLDQLAADIPPDQALLLGISETVRDGQQPDLFNSVALVEGGAWRVVARKRLLPSYDVFDERRYFRAADEPCLLELERAGRRWRIGLTICEDLWVEEELQGQRLLGGDPVGDLAALKPDLLINLSASPFGQGKPQLRRELARSAAMRVKAPVLYVNQVGGNDELIFDGGSFVTTAGGMVGCQLAFAKADLACWELGASTAMGNTAIPGDEELLLRNLVLGVRDYAHKCGFRKALLGLSGGIDSALVAVLAVAALGADNVQVLLMPSPWSSEGSISDALALANRLGIRTDTVTIEDLMARFDAALTPPLGGTPAGVTAENLQSRIRGTLLMAVANQQGQLLLTTGNKSELAVGYCTLYGDMNGGLAVIGDLYKSTVFHLCNWIDSEAAQAVRQELGLLAQGDLIGAAIREKPPSAELRPDQKDSDSLPDYAVLDPLLKALLEEHQSPEEISQRGTDPALAERVMGLLRRAEFKRRQAPPVLKLSQRAFGSGWRMPIAAKS
jgi:NAD+ synthase (glutamine-hydrolysing)